MQDSLVGLRQKINQSYRMDETTKVESLLKAVSFSSAEEQTIAARAVRLIEDVRKHPGDRTLLEDFMQRYALSTGEGLALMGLAESLLRIPDTETADALITDKITRGDWDHTEGEKTFLTTLSGWGLSLSEQMLQTGDHTMGRMVKRMGMPVIRQAITHAVKMLGGQFVSGKTLPEAYDHSKQGHNKGNLFSFDMLGEGARTDLKANEYFEQYRHAIETLAKAQHKATDGKPLFAKDGISIKISALHPRYEELQKDRCLPVLIKRVRELALLAKKHDLPVTLDAEEAERLELSLDIFEAVFADPELAGFDGFGLVVQAYQKRAQDVIAWLVALARAHGKRIPVRLVKGAYWDSEIKKAQERGLSGYPVFTRKVNTDVSYLAAATTMLEARDAIYPQFATHNAYTISAVVALAARTGHSDFEFQRLHGMGEPLYQALAYEMKNAMPPVRVYAPVGQHEDLLPYLVRRLLENGANSSFINHIYDTRMAPVSLVRNPLAIATQNNPKQHPSIPLPVDLYSDRKNSVTYDLSDRTDQDHLNDVLKQYEHHTWVGHAFYREEIGLAASNPVHSPAEPSHKVGEMHDTNIDHVDSTMQALHDYQPVWDAVPVSKRAQILNDVADHLLDHQDELIALCVYEAGKTMGDALAEIREAVDFCRYYAVEGAKGLMPVALPGPAGETNTLRYHGRGVWVCISPWNFPLAIFIGQIAAALMAGNTVAAKPAPQTGLIATRVLHLMIEAGVPSQAIALFTGDGAIGGLLTEHPLTAGIAFTGSTATAWRIQTKLAEKQSAIVPFIAETGGQNVMIADSSALPEQIVDDIIRSAFLSAGQRCSALRVLYLQDDIAPTVLNMLRGALSELRVGLPWKLHTDIGPVIDEAAQKRLTNHLYSMDVPLMEATKIPAKGYFVMPSVLQISGIQALKAEHFGPILHIVHFDAAQKNKIIDAINAYGYGLTLGIHSRIEPFIADTIARARIGNIYVNRGMTGAVVGVQPFGGMGLSGTGPKAGGPDYLKRFTVEKTITINTTAVGGNAQLANLSE